MLQNRVAVITGASRGIGRAITLRLAQSGCHVAVVYASNSEAAQAVCAQAMQWGARAMAYCCDVADFGQSQQICERILADFGQVDILINNAGVIRDNLLLKMSEADFDAVLAVNLKGAFNFCKLLSRSLMKSEAGRIINISSVAGLTGNVGQANYAAAKAGLIGLTKTLAREFAGRQVTCNAIAPGFIQTDMTATLSPTVSATLLATVPLKRLGQAEEVAALAEFLASDAAAYITGEVIRVDGGLCM